MTYILSIEQGMEYAPSIAGQRAPDGTIDMRWCADREMVPYAVTRVQKDITGLALNVKLEFLRNGEIAKDRGRWIVVNKARLTDYTAEPTRTTPTYLPAKGDTAWLYQRSFFYGERGIVFWHVEKGAAETPSMVQVYVYRYKTESQIHEDMQAAERSRREHRIRRAAERAQEFATRTKVLPALFQEKIERHRALDPVGYAVDFESEMLDIYEVAVAIYDHYMATKLPERIVAQNISRALPDVVCKYVPSANILERGQLYDAMAFAYELLTGELPDWASRSAEET